MVYQRCDDTETPGENLANPGDSSTLPATGEAEHPQDVCIPFPH